MRIVVDVLLLIKYVSISIPVNRAREKKKGSSIGCDGTQRVGGVERKWKKSLHIRVRT